MIARVVSHFAVRRSPASSAIHGFNGSVSRPHEAVTSRVATLPVRKCRHSTPDAPARPSGSFTGPGAQPHGCLSRVTDFSLALILRLGEPVHPWTGRIRSNGTPWELVHGTTRRVPNLQLGRIRNQVRVLIAAREQPVRGRSVVRVAPEAGHGRVTFAGGCMADSDDSAGIRSDSAPAAAKRKHRRLLPADASLIQGQRVDRAWRGISGPCDSSTESGLACRSSHSDHLDIVMGDHHDV